MNATANLNEINDAVCAGTLQLDETFEIHQFSGKKDDKGREIWFIRAHCKVIGTPYCYAWVQKARRVNGEVVEFGAAQRSKLFATHREAMTWTLRTADEHIAKLA